MIGRRLERLREQLEALEIDAFIVSSDENRRYMSGFTGSAGTLIISRDKAILATDFRYIEQSAMEAPLFDIFKIDGEFSKHLAKVAGSAEAAGLGFEAAHVSYDAYGTLKSAADDAGLRLKATTDVVEQLRIVKDEGELVEIQRAVDLADGAIAAVAAAIQPGMTELEAAWRIEKFIRENGGQSLSFPTIVGAGKHGAIPHWQPTDTPFQTGDPVVFDLGARVNGYCSDLTRTLFVGEPDEKFKNIYGTVLDAQLEAERGVRSGMTGEEVDGIARQVIEHAGYGEFFGHGLGHGVGLEIHEAPRVSKSSTNVIGNGMVFTIEPGIYLPDWGGVRIEDMAVLEGDRARVLSRAEKLNFGGS